MSRSINHSLESYHFKAPQEGNHLWVSAQIHGDEPAGSIAIDRVYREIKRGEIQLKSGQVFLLPRLNKPAIALHKRFVDSNLNRGVAPKQLGVGATIEDHIRQDIVRELDRFCYTPYTLNAPPTFTDRADIPNVALGQNFVLDLHSFHTPGEPHAWIYTPTHSSQKGRIKSALGFGTSYDANFEFVSALGVSRILCGWATAYAQVRNTEEIAATPIQPDVKKSLWTRTADELGFHDYAKRQATLQALRHEATSLGQRAYDNGVVATTVECGQHQDPKGAEVAYRAIRGALAAAGITDPYEPAQLRHPPELITTRSVHFRLPGDTLARPFNDLERLQPGEPVIIGAKGTPRIVAPTPPKGEETLILFPNPHAPKGIELTYFATRKVSALSR